MSYAIPADEPGGAAPAALSLLVHGVLFALLVSACTGSRSIRNRSWPTMTELPASSRPRQVEPKPEAKPQPKPEAQDRAEGVEADIASSGKRRRREESRRSSSIRRAVPRAARAGAAGAQPRPREAGGGEAVRPPAASVGDPAT